MANQPTYYPLAVNAALMAPPPSEFLSDLYFVLSSAAFSIHFLSLTIKTDDLVNNIASLEKKHFIEDRFQINQ